MKSGPRLGVPSSTIEVLKKVGFNIVTLANNHFFDQGQKGVENTLCACDELSIKVIGGGYSLFEARKPLLLEKEGRRIAFINACEHEFSIANNDHGGSNPLDLINLQEDIARVRKEVDYVVLILHGGIEHYHYPTPRMKRWYRHFVDMGANAVINHHQHCVNGYEVYKGAPIFYGLGNFYFPWDEVQIKHESWNYGYAVKLVLDEQINFEIIPYKQTSESVILRDLSVFNKEVDILNLPIQDDYLLQQKFDDFIIDHENAIKMDLLPTFMNHRLLAAFARRGWLGKLYKGKHVFLLKNKLTCESHHEIMKRLFTIMTT